MKIKSLLVRSEDEIPFPRMRVEKDLSRALRVVANLD